MPDQKNTNSALCWLRKISLVLGILVILLTASGWVVIKITAATTEINSLKREQQNKIGKDVFETHAESLEKQMDDLRGAIDEVQADVKTLLLRR